MPGRDHFRAYARRQISLGATLQEQQVRIWDLGLGGACIEWPAEGSLSQLVEPEATVLLSLVTPTLWDPLRLQGKIAWIRKGSADKPTRAGLRFEHDNPSALYALVQLLGAQVFDP